MTSVGTLIVALCLSFETYSYATQPTPYHLAMLALVAACFVWTLVRGRR